MKIKTEDRKVLKRSPDTESYKNLELLNIRFYYVKINPGSSFEQTL